MKDFLDCLNDLLKSLPVRENPLILLEVSKPDYVRIQDNWRDFIDFNLPLELKDTEYIPPFGKLTLSTPYGVLIIRSRN